MGWWVVYNWSIKQRSVNKRAKDLLDVDRLPTMEELKEFFKKNDLFSAKPLL